MRSLCAAGISGNDRGTPPSKSGEFGPIAVRETKLQAKRRCRSRDRVEGEPAPALDGAAAAFSGGAPWRKPNAEAILTAKLAGFPREEFERFGLVISPVVRTAPDRARASLLLALDHLARSAGRDHTPKTVVSSTNARSVVNSQNECQTNSQKIMRFVANL